MVISVIGLGFVGLTTALSFADKGNQVFGYDIDLEKVSVLKNGRLPFEEPGLKEAMERCLDKTFHIISSLSACIPQSDVVFFCVSTNAQKSGEVDLSHLKTAFAEVASLVPYEKKIVFAVKSTVPPTTVSGELSSLLRSYADKQIIACSNPEFMREGYAWKDFNFADRIVVGTNDAHVRTVMQQLYAIFDAPICFVSCNTAEFIKYLSNSMLATMISFSNEMAMIADSFGDIEIKRAFDILHMDGRFENGQIVSYIHPGCGYGGYCLPKDVQAISYAAGNRARLLKSVIAINRERQEYISERIVEHLDVCKEVTILGLSFKPNSDDVRESVAATVISILLEKGITCIFAYDPIAMENFKKAYPHLNIVYKDSAEEAIQCAKTVVVLTAWEEFKQLNYTDKFLLDFRYYI